MVGIASFGTYLPAWRLERAAIAAVLGQRAGHGCRSVASYDEDSTTLGVEAARRALHTATVPGRLVFATTAPAYLDKTNATAIHAAVHLDADVPAFDMIGSVRSGLGALLAALDAAANGTPTLVVAADVRSGLPGSADESNGGDAAVALLCDADDVVAEFLGAGAVTAEFLDRWRMPAENESRVWEERFGESVYLPLAETALNNALKEAGVPLDDLDRLIVCGLHARAAGRLPKKLGVPATKVSDDLAAVAGNTGAAHPGLLLADAFEHAAPGQIVALVNLSDGADALVFRVTQQVERSTAAPTVRAQLEGRTLPVSYPDFLTWRGYLRREPPRRPEPSAPAAPPSYRSEAWKYGFSASRCLACGTRHLPPSRVCLSCHAVDKMEPEDLSGTTGTVATYTVDRLSYSLSPPVVVAAVDFDGGGRIECELTDVSPDEVAIGDRVEMTFRRLYTSEGVHNYFWKARPSSIGAGGGE
jgi:hydroxymethylglutaryl-CoA synthase